MKKYLIMVEDTETGYSADPATCRAAALRETKDEAERNIQEATRRRGCYRHTK